MSFTVICNNCNSKNIVIEGGIDCASIIICQDCNQIKYGDDFEKE